MDAGHGNTNGPEILLHLSLSIKVLNLQLPVGQALDIHQATEHHVLQTQALGNIGYQLSLRDKHKFFIQIAVFAYGLEGSAGSSPSFSYCPP